MDITQEKMLHSFDTLAASKRLKEAGMPTNQAEAVTEVTATALSGLVTPGHIDKMMTLVDKRFAEVDKRFTQVDIKFAHMEVKIARWGVAIIASQLATMTLLIGYLSISL